MSENLSTQFPRPPELHPLASVQAKIRQVVSLALIISGLTLLGWGGWMFYQYQLEASKPPPRLLEVSVTEPARTFVSQPRLTQVNAPTASPQVSDAFIPANTPTPNQAQAYVGGSRCSSTRITSERHYSAFPGRQPPAAG